MSDFAAGERVRVAGPDLLHTGQEGVVTPVRTGSLIEVHFGGSDYSLFMPSELVSPIPDQGEVT